MKAVLYFKYYNIVHVLKKYSHEKKNLYTYAVCPTTFTLVNNIFFSSRCE